MNNKENQDLLDQEITDQITENKASEYSDAYYSIEENETVVTERSKPLSIKNNSHFFRDQKPENILNKRNQNAISRIQSRKSNTLNKKSSLKDPTNIKQQENEEQSDRINNKMNPLEETKENTKEMVKETAKQTTKKTAKAAGEATKKVGSAAAKGIATLATNPATALYFWATIAIASLLIMLPIFIVIITGGENDDSDYANNNTSNVNSAISLTHTKLSKEEFVTYCNKRTDHTDFYSKCDTIYEISKQNNFNPEMVVIRAYVEGFSPGGGTYNYWGIGCYNGASSSACHSYSSFEDGVKAFIKNVSQYKTVEEMVGKYAYIGDYWLNPGSSSAGGCYYFPYMEKYMTQLRASTVKSYCSGATCSGSSCHPTTADDQLAYSRYQTESMVKAGEVLFEGVTADVASNTVVDSSIPKSIDDLKNRYYFTYDLDNYFKNGDDGLFAQCVWYAKHRAMDIVASSDLSEAEKQSRIKTLSGNFGNGRDVATNLGKVNGFTRATNFDNIKAPAVISWNDGSYGHVGIIENITTDSSGNKKYYITDAGRKRENGVWYKVSKDNAWSVLLFPIDNSTSLTAEQAKNRSGQSFVAATSILE